MLAVMSLIRDTFRDRSFLSKLFRLAFPIALQAMLLATVAASDTVMLGSLEQNAMSAVSLASQIQFVQNMIVTGVVSAFQILGAQYAGKRDKNTLNRLLCMSLRICVLVSLAFSLLCFLCPASLMRIFTNEEALIVIGVGYLKIAAVSYLIAGITQCLLALIKLGANTAAVARISGVAVVLNIVLNGVFIFGLFGLPQMGVAGAALATVTARVVELVLSVIFAWKDNFLRPDLKKLFAFDKALSLDFIRQLLPLMGAYLLWTVGFTSYSAFMGHMGIDAAAANSVASVVRSLVSSFMKGLAGGAAIMVGYELGQGHLDRARTYGDRLVFMSVICGVLSGLMILGSIPLALTVVKLTPGAASDFITLSVILSIYIVGCSVNSVVINGLFASGGDTLFDVYSLAVMMWGIAVPLAAAGTFLLSWPVAVVYFCTCLDEVGKIPWTLHHYRKYRWVRDLTREVS